METHLVLRKAGKMTIQVETPLPSKDGEALADVVQDIITSARAFQRLFSHRGMVIAPAR